MEYRENLHCESVYFKELHNDQDSRILLADDIESGGSCSVISTLFFLYKNVVFPAQAEYSYFLPILG